MDLTVMAQAATAILGPCLPYLLKLGDKAAEEGAKKIGADAWGLAKSLWSKLSPKLNESPTANEAVADAAAAPEDQDLQAALRVQIRKLLARDESLASELAAFLAEHQPTGGNNVLVSGERAIGIGGNMTGSSASTGDAVERRQP
ncbi:hypothetical protein [Noviherbaspirillum suwonense]|uniref:Uncharacterized protein n=1 Tax=Noviherbaspirillum suwonense TaxID=1224511 RepID=A0ABY1QYC4_9BURK|nr:hypothetical protein [Noviherbaspirillum suwonense]SMP81210.1 hypothetical protein SAMN06295970_14212 [Noviherbaspirillum suwonense]